MNPLGIIDPENANRLALRRRDAQRRALADEATADLERHRSMLSERELALQDTRDMGYSFGFEKGMSWGCLVGLIAGAIITLLIVTQYGSALGLTS